MFSDTFYPTPKKLIRLMLSKVEGSPVKILEPSAGAGDLVSAIQDHYRHRVDISAIEIDEKLQATLRGVRIKVIDSDFLTFGAPDKFDLIIANPPFDKGAEHLLKAIEIMFRGQIVFLLNAETLRNLCTSTRKVLAQKLDELGASIEYHHGAFKQAERRTDVEVALVHIKIKREVDGTLFKGVEDAEAGPLPEHEENYDVTTGKLIPELVAEYNKIVRVGTDTIIGFYKNFRTVGKYLTLNDIDEKNSYRSSEDLTTQMQAALNDLLNTVRKDFWRRTLEIKEVRRRLTRKKNEEFEHKLTSYCHMDFTEKNILQFVLNLMAGHEKTLTEAVLDIFNMFTRHGYMGESIYEKNVHYFNGWKTNNAFKVGKKVIIPIYAGYGSEGPFRGYSGWKLDWQAREILRDIDIVMNYFDGYDDYQSIGAALEASFTHGSNQAESSYFNIIAYKKGTIHLTFKDMGILRRFNLAACRGKGWLPDDYGARKFNELSHEEKAVATAFEGQASYNKNVGLQIFSQTGLLQLTDGGDNGVPEREEDQRVAQTLF